MLPFLVAALAAAPLPDFEAHWKDGAVVVRALPPDGEHVAADAPASGWVEFALTDDPLRQLESTPPPRRSEFRTDGAALVHGIAFAATESQLRGEARLGLCVDEGTECRFVDVAFEGALQGRRARARLVGRAPGRARIVRRVFKVSSAPIETMFALAESQGRLPLLDFAAQWCPPCNLLAAQVLDDPDEGDVLGPFLVVRIDVDRKESWPWKDRYRIGPYPTVVVVRPDGTEIDRLVGYPGEEATRAWLRSVRGLPAVGTDPASLAPEEAAAMARRLALAGRGAEAAPYLARAAERAAETVDFRTARLVVEARPEDARWLAAHDTDPLPWIEAGVALVEKDPTLGPVLRAALVRSYDEGGGARAADLLFYEAALAPESERPSLYRAAAWALTTALTGDPALDRGQWDFLADLYESAGELDRAQAVRERAVAAFPDEFAFHHALARFLLRTDQPSGALPEAEAALTHAFGDNRLRAVETLARALAVNGRRAEALAAIDRALAETERPPDGLEVRTFRYLDDLARARAEIAAEPDPTTGLPK